MTKNASPPKLRRALGFRDLVLFYVVTVFGPRWMATAAAAGPSAITIWLIAGAAFFIPVVFTTLELSTRYPEEGGIYVWSREAFGPFTAFMCGWMYWTANLPYFPSMLYFAAGNVLFVGGSRWQGLSTSAPYFMSVSLAGLVIAVWMNVRGIGTTKWLSNVGGLTGWVAGGFLIVLGGVWWTTHGSAAPIAPRAFVPSTGLKDVVFWSTIAFAFGGIEGASTLGGEIHDPRRTVPRAVIAAALLVTVLYIAGTLAVLVSVPRDQVSSLQGVVQAVRVMSGGTAAGLLVPIVAILLTVNALGGVGGWFAAAGRLPFVAGIDGFLPEKFAAVHPQWHTPYVALLVQAAIAAVFVVLGQAGTSVRGAYEVLVSMSIITYFIPYLIMFAAMVRVQRIPAPAGVVRAPGGPGVGAVLGVLGFLTTAASIILACVPAADEANKALAVAKVVGLSAALVAIGLVVYAVGARRRRFPAA